MRRAVWFLLIIFLIGAYHFLTSNLWDERKLVRESVPAGYVLPSKASRILALGNKGVVSDYVFLKTMTFIGGRNTSGLRMSEDDWAYVAHSLDVVTDLDPYFVDPYFLGEGLLAWDANQPEAANELLKKGMEYRTWDWRLPYFVGFNLFYFMKDYTSASEFLMQTSDLPGSPAYIKTLAARLAYYGGQSKTALLFLKEMLVEAQDPLLRRRLEMRLVALRGAVAIEDALENYQIEKGEKTKSLQTLLSEGYLERIPVDPYGGDWIISTSGRVYSTSRFAPSKE